jgi:hypothetical protein
MAKISIYTEQLILYVTYWAPFHSRRSRAPRKTRRSSSSWKSWRSCKTYCSRASLLSWKSILASWSLGPWLSRLPWPSCLTYKEVRFHSTGHTKCGTPQSAQHEGTSPVRYNSTGHTKCGMPQSARCEGTPPVRFIVQIMVKSRMHIYVCLVWTLSLASRKKSTLWPFTSWGRQYLRGHNRVFDTITMRKLFVPAWKWNPVRHSCRWSP